jgi:protein MpaA
MGRAEAEPSHMILGNAFAMIAPLIRSTGPARWLAVGPVGQALACLVIAAGCASSPRAHVTPRPTPRLAITSDIIGRSVQGRDIECLIVGEGPVVVMMLATIHGDEPAGTPLLERLARQAAFDPSWMHDRTLVLIPVANPDGYEVQRRGNANGVDLNRNFPAMSFTSRGRHGEAPLSEPESLALHAALDRFKPRRIVSIHQPLNCIDYDGDGQELAESMANATDETYRLRINKLGAYPGSLGSFAGEDLGIPIITIEFSGAAHRVPADTLWQRYGEMLIAAVAFPAVSSEHDEQSRPHRER